MFIDEVPATFHLPVGQRGAEHEVYITFPPGLLDLCLACRSTHVEVLYIRVGRALRRQHKEQWLLRVDDLQGLISALLSAEVPDLPVTCWDCQVQRHTTPHAKSSNHLDDSGWNVYLRNVMFAPKFVENKLKFYPSILEAVVFGAARDHCCAFINIDLEAVGNWAERNNISYASYQELAGHPQVLDSIQGYVEEINRQVAVDDMLSGCQIHRFLILHKELDADDGELTRTRKVRRKVITEKFKDLVDALYDGSQHIDTETEVTYEDGRKGKISARLTIREAAVQTPVQKVAAE